MGYIDFSFNGINARDMGVKSVRVDESIMTFPFVSNSDLATSKPMGRIDLSLHKVERANLVIPLQLLLCDENGNPKIWSQRDIFEIANWLVTDNYKILELGNQSGIYYNAVLVNSEGLHHYANGGILPVEFSTNSPYAWSIPKEEQFEISSSTVINVVGGSNAVDYYYPYMEIKKTSSQGDVKIQNLTTDDKEIEIKDMFVNETITLDNDWELCKTDKAMATMHDRFNYEWLRLRRGNNRIKVTGACEIKFVHNYPVIAQWR